MSDKGSTATLDKSQQGGSGVSIGNQIRAIMGKAPKKGRFAIGKSSAEKQASKLYDQAEKELANWLDKKADALGWLHTEYEAFNEQVKAARALKGTGPNKSFADAADALADAKALAVAADLAKADRAEVKSLLKEISEKLGAAKSFATDGEAKKLMLAIVTRAAKLNEGLNRGDEPGSLKVAAEELLEEAESKLDPLVPNGQGSEKIQVGPTRNSPEVENARLTQYDRLHSARSEQMTLCLKAAEKVQSPRVKDPAGAMTRMVSAVCNEAADLVSPFSDNNAAKGGLKNWATASDPDRIQNLAERGNNAVKKIMDGCEELRTNLAKDQSGFVDKASLQEKELGGEKLKEAQARFEKDYAKVETALAQLADIGCPLLDTLKSDAEATKDRVIGAKAFDTGEQEIQAMLNKLATMQTYTLGKTSGEAQRLKAELKSLRSELSKAFGRFDKRLKPAYKALIEEAEQVHALLSTGNPAALKSAEQVMAKIRATGLGAAIATIAGLVTTAEEIKAIASSKKVASEFESESNEVLLAIKTTFDNLDIYAVTAAATTLAGVKLDAEKLQTNLTELGNWRQGMSTRLNELKQKRSQLEKLLKAEKVDASGALFELHYRAVSDGYKGAGVDKAALEKRLLEAEQGFANLITLLTSGNPGDRGVALQQLNQAKTAGQAFVDNENLEEEQAKKRHEDLQARMKEYKRLWSETKTLVEKEPQGDKEELEELKVLGEQVRKQWRAGDDAAAEKQLAAIEKRLNALKSSPGGVTAKSVSDLSGITQMWTNAVEAVKTALDEIGTAAKEAADQANLGGDKVQQRLLALDGRIRTFNLREPVLQLADKDAAVAARKKAREQALKNVRALRDLLDNDPTAVKLELNPFGVRKPFAKLRRFLNEVEYNSLRAVPPQ